MNVFFACLIFPHSSFIPLLLLLLRTSYFEMSFLFLSPRTGYFRTGWTLVLPVINVDTYLSPWECRNTCFLFTLCHMTVWQWEKELGRQFSIPQCKYSGSFSVMFHMEMCPSSYFQWYEFVKVAEFSVKVAKVTFRTRVLNSHILPLLFYLIFN